MIKYTARQVFISVQLFLGISIVVFIVISLYPGDPVTNLFGPYGQAWSNGQDTAELQARFSGHTPGPVRYLFWMKEVVTGNLGVSIVNPRPVAEIISRALPVTLGFAVAALGVAALAGVAIGVVTCGSEQSILIRALSALLIFLASVPTVFLAIWGAYVFALRLDWLPPFGLWTPGADRAFNLDLLHHAILPTVALALPCVAAFMRHARQSIVHSHPQESERDEAERGANDTPTRSRHVFRSTLAPLLRNLHLTLPALIGSALFVEIWLSLGGIGSLAYSSVTPRDYPVLTAAVLAGAVSVLAVRLLAELIYGWLDPSIRQSPGRSTPTPGEPGTAGPDATARQLGPPLELIDRPLEHRPWNTARRRFLSQRTAATGFVILALFVAMAVLAPTIAPFDPNKQFPLLLRAEPSATHWLGTDRFGRDVFSVLVHGARTSLWTGAMAVVISLVIGFAVGGTAGRMGGRIDTVLMRITDVVGVFPALFLILFLVIPFSLIFGHGSAVALLIGIVSWPGFARLIRRQTLVKRDAALSRSAVAGEDDRSDSGSREPGSLAGPVAVAAAYGFAAALLLEVTLSFLGLGTVFPAPSWGQMIGQSGVVVAPAILTVLAVLSAHLVADGLRNVFDARCEEPQAVEPDDESAAPDEEHSSP